MSAAQSESEHTIVDPNLEEILGDKALEASTPIELENYNGKEQNTLSDVEKGVRPGDAPRVQLSGLKFALVFAGLSLSVFLAALDQTIVATTLNAVGNQFQAYTEISWIGTAYLLSATGFGPSWGRLSDVFGRKYTYMAAIFFFELGSALCGAAPNINVLILGRAIAGLGGGGILGLTLIIITDMVSIREAGKYAGVIGACFGLSSVVGPLLGGAFTDHITWRWAYFINLPIGGCAALVVFLFLNIPREKTSITEKLKKLDYLGSFVVLAAVILILIGVNWGGSTYPWTSGQVLAPLIIGCVLFVVFIVVEGKIAISPIMPLSLFRNRTLIGTFLASFMFGGAFFGMVYFTPIFFQIVIGNSATTAGLQMIPLVLSLVIMGIAAGIVVSKTGYYRPFMIIGMAVATVGMGLMTTWDPSLSDGKKIGYPFIIGIGLGWNIQNVVLITQNAVDIKEVAVATAAVTFFRTLGGTIAIAIMQSVFNTKVATDLAPYASKLPISISALQAEPALISKLPESIQGYVISSFSDAITRAYLVSAAMAAAAALALCLMENRPLRTKRGGPPAIAE